MHYHHYHYKASRPTKRDSPFTWLFNFHTHVLSVCGLWGTTRPLSDIGLALSGCMLISQAFSRNEQDVIVIIWSARTSRTSQLTRHTVHATFDNWWSVHEPQQFSKWSRSTHFLFPENILACRPCKFRLRVPSRALEDSCGENKFVARVIFFPLKNCWGEIKVLKEALPGTFCDEKFCKYGLQLRQDGVGERGGDAGL